MTTLFVIDPSLDVLATQGSLNGTPVSPNSGQLFTVGSLGLGPGSQFVGFDISGPSGIAYLSALDRFGKSPDLYTINLSTGAATLVGPIGGGVPVTGGLAAPVGNPVPERATLLLLSAGVIGLRLKLRNRRKSQPVDEG